MSAGGAWIKIDRKGNSYLSCQIELDGKKINFFLFKNYKKEKKQPDYKIILADDKKNQVINDDIKDDFPF